MESWQQDQDGLKFNNKCFNWSYLINMLQLKALIKFGKMDTNQHSGADSFHDCKTLLLNFSHQKKNGKND